MSRNFVCLGVKGDRELKKNTHNLFSDVIYKGSQWGSVNKRTSFVKTTQTPPPPPSHIETEKDHERLLLLE